MNPLGHSDEKMDGYVMLETLPEDDRLRTTPLHLIGAEYFHVKDAKTWRPVTPDKFWGFSYNDLLGPWTAFSRWRAPIKGTTE